MTKRPSSIIAIVLTTAMLSTSGRPGNRYTALFTGFLVQFEAPFNGLQTYTRTIIVKPLSPHATSP